MTSKELEIGMYVRTKDFGITKIYSINEAKTKWKYTFKIKHQDEDGCVDLGVLCDDDILKASHNIIDLIEVGDYVNGELIKYIHNDFIQTSEKYYKINDFAINSIVTKKQFESMSYKVGD